MNMITVRGFTPQVGQDVFIAHNSAVIGDVHLGDRSSVWYNVTIRGDVMPIRIGKESNIQDGSVLHGTYGQFGCEVGERVTVGHLVTLHGCKIGNECLIGMGSTIMDGAEISEKSIVAAGSLVTEGKKFPAGVLIMGRPAKVARPLTPEEIGFLSKSADNYLLYKSWYSEKP